MLEPVERAGDRRRRADLRLDDDDVLRGDGAAAELASSAVERLARVDPPLAVRQHVAQPAERVARLVEAELADVARDGRLGDAAAGALERVEQLLLSAEPHALDQARDEPLALGLRQLALGLHKTSIVYAACLTTFRRASAQATRACCGKRCGPASTPGSAPPRRSPPAGSRRRSGGWRPAKRRRRRNDEGRPGSRVAPPTSSSSSCARPQRSGGVKAKVGDALADDPAFLRKLKPSLIKARARVRRRRTSRRGPRSAPSGPQLARPKPRRRKRGAARARGS